VPRRPSTTTRWPPGPAATSNSTAPGRRATGSSCGCRWFRGSVALCRGPLLYAVELVDQPDGVLVDDLVLTGRRLTETPTTDGPPAITAPGAVQGLPASLYTGEPAPLGDAVEVRAVPYHRWANRGTGAMKVWLPYAT
jgi:DUF1680 family protein